MACSNCNTPNCGCSGTYVVSQTCPPACSEVFNSACIVYTGVDIICNDTTVSPAVPTTIVRRNDYLDTALTAIVQYVCSRFNTQIHPTTVVDSGDAFILVSSDVVGAQTTYTITLDPSTLPTASEVTGGVNVTVTGDGTPTTDPYVVNAQGSIVAVAPGTALSVIADADTPGPFDTTYTIDIDYDLLPDTILATSQGYINIAESPNVPNAGDMTYTLDVDQVTVTAADVRLTSTETAAGGAPNFLRTFDIAIDETEMTHWIMESVIYSPGNVGPGLIEGPGIQLNYNPATYQLQIENLFSDPFRWFELIDFLGTTVIPTVDNATLSILADPATVALGGSGIDAVLSGTGTAAQYDLLNTDPGTAQLIFGSVEVLGEPTITADSNTEVLTFIEGANIGLVTNNGVGAKSITIVNEIDFVFSSVAGDTGVVQAANTVDQVQFVGGESITTTAAGGGPATVTIDWDGVVTDATLTGDGTAASPLTVVPALAVSLASAGGTSLVSNGVGPALEILGLTAGTGIAFTISASDVTINAEVQRESSTVIGAFVPTTLITNIPHGLGEQFVSIRLFDETTNLGDDVTDQFTITCAAVNDISLLSNSFTGSVRVLAIG